MEDKEAKSILEALLFISGEPLTLDTLEDLLELNKKEVERLVKELINDYLLRNSGFFVAEVAGGVQMVTNPGCAPWVKKLLATAFPTRLSHQSIETLAIVAYKQPIIKAEVEAIRGVNCDGVLRTLLERRMIKILGRKEAPGRPLMYGTTKEFLQYFGLKDLSELPTLKEFRDVGSVPEPMPSEIIEETVQE
ncbi:MAG: SMC-Scp complex subunit ScpB [Nitrospirota bacterium]